MRINPGVKLESLKAPMLVALQVAEGVYARNGCREVVVTSGEDGRHMPSSLHYVGFAVDIRSPTEAMEPIILRALRDSLGPDFDVVSERSPRHIHIEYDPA